ncbi:MAG: AbrB/MazE/SpoVT family DNA-binding domain-containing protein [Bacteroidota bacterium]|nr:AbrB/MazE/SpoVT family DNA-binding domain-containing protein [Bacteroidota bacterium]
MQTSVVTTNGRITVPAKLRRKLKLKPGTKLAFIEQEDGIVVKPLNKKYFESFAGILGTDGKMLKALMRERKKEREREL